VPPIFGGENAKKRKTEEEMPTVTASTSDAIERATDPPRNRRFFGTRVHDAVPMRDLKPPGLTAVEDAKCALTRGVL
jgi:hypothetical protein